MFLSYACRANFSRPQKVDLGAPIKIADLARDMIELSGLKPGEDIDIEYTGLRPGERLPETIFTDL